MFRYGIDAPFWVVSSFVMGVLMISSTFGPGQTGLSKWIGVIWGIVLCLIALFMLYYSAVTKLKHRDRILKAAEVKTGKHILDVGTGRGLLAIQAAKWGASTVAIDIWSKKDLSGNGRGRKNFEQNASQEGMLDKIRVFDADVRKLPFQKQIYDAVVSNFVIHNLTKDREVAIKEMWRVLKPGGLLVISDIRGIKEYKNSLQKLNCKELIVKGPYFDTFPFARILIAKK